MAPNPQLQQLIQETKQRVFKDPSIASDEEALGILISQHFTYGGVEILRTASSALEDSNFHEQASQIDDMIDIVENN